MHRRVLSRGSIGLTRFLLATARPRCQRRISALTVSPSFAKFRLDEIRATGYAYLEEILWHLHRAGRTFAEVPITFRERRAGQSKINLGEAWGKLARSSGFLCRRDIAFEPARVRLAHGRARVCRAGQYAASMRRARTHALEEVRVRHRVVHPQAASSYS